MSYSADNIKVLNDIEHIQLRSGMYIGEANDPRSYSLKCLIMQWMKYQLGILLS
jgi:DNA gyrase/topoisomerase IV subunit B